MTVDEPGRHTLQYRAWDNSGNVSQVQSKAVSVDPQAPTTTAATQSAGANGPVSVTLNANDGNGAGIERTEYRVDGGAWRDYSAPAADEVLFDGTAASLANWAQAGPGQFVLAADDSMETTGGLGMLWYPVKPFGDFSLKLQFREARTDGGYSNGGVFVRFPDPRIPLAQRPSNYTYTYDGQVYTGNHCSRVGSAATQPAWVAINCGHEIQVHDNPGGGEPQKTGSIYNFQAINSSVQPGAGEWTDYEVRVVGQQYTIIRDGQIVNSFDNAVPRNATRAGDPPTQARQFAEGYIGLQNHGGTDRYRYRNVRVQDLSDDARTGTGAFAVSGRGNHTVEFRSTDNAGNTEAKKMVSFRIGSATQPPSPPGNPPTNPNPPGGDDKPAAFRLGKLAKTTRAKFVKSGLRVRVTCTDAMVGRAQLKVTRKVARKLGLGKRTVLASKSVRCAGQGSRTVTLKAGSKVKRALRKARGSVKTTLEVRLKATGERPRSPAAR